MFCPNGLSVQATIAAVNTPQLVTLPAFDPVVGALRLHTGTTMFVAFGDATVVATTSDFQLYAGETEYLIPPAGATCVSILTPATHGATLNVDAGVSR